MFHGMRIMYRLPIALLLALMSPMAALAASDMVAERDDLRIRLVPGERGLELFYKGMLVARRLGSFHVYQWELSGAGRATVFQMNGLDVTEARIAKDGFSTDNSRSDDTVHYNLDVALQPGNAVDIELRLKINSTVRPHGLQFDIARVIPDWIKGAMLSKPGSSDRKQLQRLPIEPMPHDKRILMTGLNGVNVRGSAFDMNIEPLTANTNVAVADFRNVEWDRSKTFLFYERQRFIATGVWHSYRYRITFGPPTLTAMEQYSSANTRQRSERPHQNTGFFNFMARTETRDNGAFILGKDLVVSTAAEAGKHGQIETILTARLDHPPRVRVVASQQGLMQGITMECEESVGAAAQDRGGFRLDVRKDGVVLQGQGEEGCVNGLRAINGAIQETGGVKQLAVRRMTDQPDFPVRGQVIRISPGQYSDAGLFKRYLAALARARANTVIIYHPPEHAAALRSGVPSKVWWSRDQLSDVIAYARSLGLNVIPGMLSKFDRKDFPEILPETGNSNLYCVDREESYRFLFSLYEVLLDTYRPGEFLIGHDEIAGLTSCDGSSVAPAELFARDVSKIHRWLKSRNVRTIMWGDMLLDHDRWQTVVGSANGGNPSYGSGDTHKAIDLLPRDIVILDWHYQVKADYPSIQYFRQKGFEVWGVAWFDATNAINMAKSAKRYAGNGMLGSDWGFWVTLSPASTTLYALAAGWNSGITAHDNGQDALTAFSGMLRVPVTEGRFIPIGLREMANEVTYDAAFADGRGFLDLGPGFDLRQMPEGKQAWCGIEFDVATSEEGQRENIIVVRRNSPEAAGTRRRLIPIGRVQARNLAFLHTMLNATPGMQLDRVGSYIVEYEDGSSEKIDLLEGFNITDFRSTPGLRVNPWGIASGAGELVGAWPGWSGRTLSGTPVNTQILVWNNPHPDKPIAAITVVIEGQESVAGLALLGLSYLP